MTHRERVRRAVEFDGPDRAPRHHYIFPGAFRRHGQKLVDLVTEIPDDFDNINVRTTLKIAQETPEAGNEDVKEWRDAWGTLWRGLQGYTSGDVIEPGIPDWDGWGSYEFPPPAGPETYESLRKRAEAEHPEWYVYGSGGSIFAMTTHLRGPANFYLDLAEERPEIYELLDRLVDRHVAHIQQTVATGVDGVFFGDDLGGQERLLVSPTMWRKVFKPRYQRMFDAVKDAGLHVWLHTDGWTFEILDDLIEIGVDVLNPQHCIMGSDRVAEKIAGRICLRSDLDRQHIIPRGTPDEIVAHVKEIMELFGNFNGGIVLHGEVGPDVPFENIQALYRAMRDYGDYPLGWLG